MAAELLRDAREWLADPAHWTRQALWTQGGHVLFVGRADPDEVESTCALGALYLCHTRQEGVYNNSRTAAPVAEAAAALSRVASELGYGELTQLNDFASYEDVLAMYDEAIRRATPLGGLEEPSVPYQVPGPQEQPQEAPYYPPAAPREDPVEAPPVHVPAPAEPVPA